MNIQKMFKVTIKDPDAWIPEVFHWMKAADDLGLRRPSKNGKSKKVSNAYSFDLNMSMHCPGFKECPVHQRNMIIDFFKKYEKLFSAVDIYAENKGFTRNDTRPFVYTFYAHAKLHWHGTLYMHKEFNKDTVVERFIKDMRKRFSCASATTTFRAVYWKKIESSLHLSDRVAYIQKQQPLVCKPIKYDNRIKMNTSKKKKKRKLEKNI